MALKTKKHGGRISLEASLERYDRQIRTKGWGIEEQRKLYDSRVLLIGCDILGEMTIGCLVSLGVGNILIMDNIKKKEKSFLANGKKSEIRVEEIATKIKKISPYINVKGINSRFAESFLDYEDFKPDVMIDTTNDLSSKERVLEYALKNYAFLISSYCNHKKSIFSVYNPQKNNVEEILNSESIIEEDREQGAITSGINAGMITDELRKSLFSLNDRDRSLEKRILYNLDSSKRTSLSSDINKAIGKIGEVRTLVVGAGAIGNYVALNLALCGFKFIDIIDFDDIDDTNLNRQILFSENVGEKKAKILSEKIKGLGKVKSRAFVYKITEDSEKFFRKNKYDIIFGCLDNFEARYYLNQFTVDLKIPYIDGGTNDISGNLAIYYPKETACIKCKKNLKPEPIKRSCGDALPSVVVPNIIIGSAMVGEAANILRGEVLKKRLVYDSFNRDRFYLQKESGMKGGCTCLN